MNKIFIIGLIISLFSCDFGMSPGTLGSVGNESIDCDNLTVSNSITYNNKFVPKLSDSTKINYWKINGYDFLNYKCLVIRKRLYMITINNDGGDNTEISIRAYYNTKNKNWIYATSFNNKEITKAEFDIEYLIKNINQCEE